MFIHLCRFWTAFHGEAFEVPLTHSVAPVDHCIFMSSVHHLANVLFCPDFTKASYFFTAPPKPMIHFTQILVFQPSFLLLLLILLILLLLFWLNGWQPGITAPHYCIEAQLWVSCVGCWGVCVLTANELLQPSSNGNKLRPPYFGKLYLFFGSSECHCCVHICPKELDFKAGHSLIVNNHPKQARCEY